MLTPRADSLIDPTPASPEPGEPGSYVRRRFVRVQGRGVHYLRAGDGPPVVLLHSATLSANAELPLIRELAADHTVFAFDNPGFGDSDPLPIDDVRIEDAADALAATFDALGIPRCPVYGSHTGGDIAAEFARRHPDRVTALMISGVNMFRSPEAEFLGGDGYLPITEIRDDGSHLFGLWVKSRDATTWFPWSLRTGDRRLAWPFPEPAALQRSYLERLRAGNTYQAVYGAVFRHDMFETLSALHLPATFFATRSDILFPHLDRLPPPKDDQVIRRLADEDYPVEVARIVRGYRVDGRAPADAEFVPTAGVVNRRYVDLPGGQILVRSISAADPARPILLLHDGRASSRVFEPIMRELSRRRPVFAIDLPDNGASDTLARADPTIADYAEVVERVVTRLGIEHGDVYGVGAGAAVALEVCSRGVLAAARLVLEAPDFYELEFARGLKRDWVPPLEPQWDGSHVLRLWLMLRDEHAFWPWFDTSSACAVDAPTDWTEFHDRVVDILRSLPTYPRLPRAALRYEWQRALREFPRDRLTLATTASEPRRRHVEAAGRLSGLPVPEVLPDETDAKARAILRLLESDAEAGIEE